MEIRKIPYVLELVNFKNQQGIHGPQLNVIYPSELEGKSIPERQWVVKDWIPFHSVTALYGDGGTGKSLLAMQLMTACARGEKWLGLETQQINSFGFFCEDTIDELHFRQNQININQFCSFSDLCALSWASGVGQDNILVDYESGKKTLTKLYSLIKSHVKRTNAQLIVIDTAADTFGGNENARGDVRAFINALARLALDIDGAVLLCAHPSVAGMQSGRGDGGNTAWNNSVRSRLYLSRSAESKNDEIDPDIRTLSRKKSNYARTGEDLSLRYSNGSFVTESAEKNNSLDHEIIIEKYFLEKLDKIHNQGRELSAAKNSSSYAPKTIKTIYKTERKFTVKQLEDAMERLFEKNQIQNVTVGTRSRVKKIIQRSNHDVEILPDEVLI